MADKVVLTDGSGKWFDADKAIVFCEATRWDGNNHISRATGSQWEHQRVYYTASGNWILSHWSQWQGSTPTVEEIDEDAAVQWLIEQECWEVGELPDEVGDRVREGMEAAEL